MKSHVLFLCTGNSCRSQMAEGLVNHLIVHEWQAYSAGTRPAGYVHPLAIRAMAELDIDISKHQPKTPDAFRETSFEVVMTVCDNAAQECPVWLGDGQKIHLPFVDPAEARGSDEEKMIVFRQVRDQIRQQVLPFLLS